ncbi:acyl-CoA/acyl-ACP dehydrogenase [Alphaproteobacteria bacterium]|nr:acyl-CoA/acyl-ACP dehydrogenase [Alphaproteobacteria bacterium]
MYFNLNQTQLSIIDSVQNIMKNFDDDYWLQCDKENKFPHKFYEAIASGGWLGICMPKQFGGTALGISDASIFMQKVSETGGGMAAASSIHINIFGPHPIVVYGNNEQKEKWLPPLISGKEKTCFGVTEPDAGLDTGKLKTFAKKINDGYLVNGQKIWTSTAKIADKILLLARTIPVEECKKNTDGLTLFYTELDRKKIEVKEISKMGRAAVDSNQIFIDNLEVPDFDRIGEEGKGFKYILDSLNPERILIAAEALGIGKNALSRAVKYASDRIVFDRPIGKNQSIQHPLAENWIELEAAELLIAKAAYQYDNGQNAGGMANAAKFFAAEAGFKAATQAVITLGGMGYAKEYHVERLLRESLIPKLAPVSAQMILNYISERVLGLPKSY